MGCTSVHHVAKAELAKLDGFREQQTSLLSALDPRTKAAPVYRLTDEKGEVHTFDESSRLVLFVRKSGKQDEIEARYKQVDVKPDLFVGIEKDTAREIRVPMDEIERAGLRKFSIGKTAALVGGIAGVALVGLIVLAVVSDGSSSGGGGGGGSSWDVFD